MWQCWGFGNSGWVDQELEWPLEKLDNQSSEIFPVEIPANSFMNSPTL